MVGYYTQRNANQKFGNHKTQKKTCFLDENPIPNCISCIWNTVEVCATNLHLNNQQLFIRSTNILEMDWAFKVLAASSFFEAERRLIAVKHESIIKASINLWVLPFCSPAVQDAVII